MQLALFQCLPQRLAGTEHLFLPDEFVQVSRPHAVGQRPQGVIGRRVAQQVGLRRP